MSQNFPHFRLRTRKGTKSYNMFGLADVGVGLNLGNLEYRQSVAKRHPKLVLKSVYLMDLDNVD